MLSKNKVKRSSTTNRNLIRMLLFTSTLSMVLSEFSVMNKMSKEDRFLSGSLTRTLVSLSRQEELKMAQRCTSLRKRLTSTHSWKRTFQSPMENKQLRLLSHNKKSNHGRTLLPTRSTMNSTLNNKETWHSRSWNSWLDSSLSPLASSSCSSEWPRRMSKKRETRTPAEWKHWITETPLSSISSQEEWTSSM